MLIAYHQRISFLRLGVPFLKYNLAYVGYACISLYGPVGAGAPRVSTNADIQSTIIARRK